MWQSLWPDVPVDEVPIGHVTNGVHFRSWISLEMNQLYDRYLGPNWREEPANGEVWSRVHSIPAEELWRTHERRRERLVAWARNRVRDQRIRRGAPHRRNRRRRRGARSRRADHRFCAPLRHLQARHADLPRHGAAASAC